MESTHGNKAVIAVVTLALGLAVGGGVGYAAASNMNNDSNMSQSSAVSEKNPNTSTKAAELRVGMNNLLREHVSSSLDVTRAIADEAPMAEIDGAKSAQTANAVAIAGVIGDLYGDEAKEEITGMFVDHIEESNNYAAAVAAGDDAKKQAAQKELDEYLVEISAFFSGAINDLPQDTVLGLLKEHESLLNQSVEAYDAGDFEQSYTLEREALTQVSGISDALAEGIVATNPEKF